MTKKPMFYFISIVSIGLVVVLIGILTSYKVRLYEHNVDIGIDCKIGHITDTHFTSEFDPTPFEQTRDDLNESDLDILVFTGDLFQVDEVSDSLEDDVTSFLQTFEATHKYAVLGNHDYYGDDKQSTVVRILENAGFQVLYNEDVTLTINDQEIHVIGLDDLRFGDTNYTTILDTTTQYTHNIVLAHEPDTFHIVKSYDVLMMLSGHSHGGQVRIPLVGSMFNVEGAKDYNNRFYEEENTKLFISFGLGESLLPIRMFNPRAMEVYQCS